MGLFATLVKPFFSKVFVVINIDSNFCNITIKRIKGSRTISTHRKEYKLIDSAIPFEAVKLVRGYKKKYPFTYLVSMLKTFSQGMVIHKLDREVIMGELKMSAAKIVRHDGLSFFASKNSVTEYERSLSVFGELDFIFSPFWLICDHIKKYPTPGRNLYVLLQRSTISLVVADGLDISFANVFLADSEVYIKDDDNNRLESFGIKSFEEMVKENEFSDFDENQASVESLKTDLFIPNLDSDANKHTNDVALAVNIAKIILDSMGEYYKNPVYASDFIDRVVFLDACEFSDDAYEELTKRIMLESVRRDFNLDSVLVETARMEIKE